MGGNGKSTPLFPFPVHFRSNSSLHFSLAELKSAQLNPWDCAKTNISSGSVKLLQTLLFALFQRAVAELMDHGFFCIHSLVCLLKKETLTKHDVNHIQKSVFCPLLT